MAYRCTKHGLQVHQTCGWLNQLHLDLTRVRAISRWAGPALCLFYNSSVCEDEHRGWGEKVKKKFKEGGKFR